MDEGMTSHDDARNAALTHQVIASLEHCTDPRLRALMSGLIRHLHAFALEESLTESEWLAGVRFLTAVGQICSDRRQEFILLSDTLGVSMLVDLINHASGSGATESTVLGPFYVADSPWRSNGDAITDDLGNQPLLVSGRVLDTAGTPLPGATVDVWQNAPNRLYAVQDETQSPENLRGRFRTGAGGGFAFRTIRPVDYPIPDDGPVGRMLHATGRHPWRPAHIHFVVSADGYRPVTTHVFDSESPYLQSDAVFGVKHSLVRTFDVHDGAHEPMPAGINGRWYTVDVDIVLEADAAVSQD
jgi:protocatechuate 3,4-dioxygenase beta subunit